LHIGILRTGPTHMYPAVSRPCSPFRLNNDQPREKLLQRGPASLTDGELLRILIGLGSAQASGADLADHLLDHLLVAGPQVVSISG
jgi:hypothetical protein